MRATVRLWKAWVGFPFVLSLSSLLIPPLSMYLGVKHAEAVDGSYGSLKDFAKLQHKQKIVWE